MLNEVSKHIHVVQLQGHIFFGNILKLCQYVRKILREHASTEYLVLDFTLVVALDSSSMEKLSRMKYLCDRHKCHLVFGSIPSQYGRFAKEMMKAFGPGGTKQNPRSSAFQVALDLNGSIEWCEDHLLRSRTKHLSESERNQILIKPLNISSDHGEDELGSLVTMIALAIAS